MATSKFEITYQYSLHYVSVGQCCSSRYKSRNDLWFFWFQHCDDSDWFWITLYLIVMMWRSLLKIFTVYSLECRAPGESFLFIRVWTKLLLLWKNLAFKLFIMLRSLHFWSWNFLPIIAIILPFFILLSKTSDFLIFSQWLHLFYLKLLTSYSVNSVFTWSRMGQWKEHRIYSQKF